MVLPEDVLSLTKQIIDLEAQDLYFLPNKINYRICYKKHNDFSFLKEIDNHEAQRLMNQLKYIANLDIAEHRRPQNGSFQLDDYPDINFRLSTLANYELQESLVMRIIYSQNKQNYFLDYQFKQLQENILNRGMIVFSGPVGSGKTTTMYELASYFAKDKMIMTIEDPVEIKSVHYFQTQVNSNADMSYSDLLKAALRHRPDILIIGEIRDEKTAKVAVQAALSGHLILTTIHARNTYGIINRFKSLGVDLEELKSCVNLFCYQRLLPKVDGELSCLLDILPNHEINYNNQKKQYHSWQDNLQQVYNSGEIDEQTFQTFKQG